MENVFGLPSVEQWWPHLDIPAKQWLVGHLDEPIPAHIVAEICALCGIDPPGSDATTEAVDLTLSVSERNFIATQIELVD